MSLRAEYTTLRDVVIGMIHQNVRPVDRNWTVEVDFSDAAGPNRLADALYGPIGFLERVVEGDRGQAGVVEILVPLIVQLERIQEAAYQRNFQHHPTRLVGHVSRLVAEIRAGQVRRSTLTVLSLEIELLWRVLRIDVTASSGPDGDLTVHRVREAGLVLIDDTGSNLLSMSDVLSDDDVGQLTRTLISAASAPPLVPPAHDISEAGGSTR